jgi:hypothetical protein
MAMALHGLHQQAPEGEGSHADQSLYADSHAENAGLICLNQMID